MNRKLVVAAALTVAFLGSAESCETSTDDGKTYAERRAEDNKGNGSSRGKDDADSGPNFSSGQENAIASAEDYLDTSAFSEKGLIDQLQFEGYSKKDATFAVNHVDVDWMQQAVASAEDYLDTSAFSEKGLADQLTFEGFTPKQAAFGARQALKK
jgi:hypothetical protein